MFTLPSRTIIIFILDIFTHPLTLTFTSNLRQILALFLKYIQNLVIYPYFYYYPQFKSSPSASLLFAIASSLISLFPYFLPTVYSVKTFFSDQVILIQIPPKTSHFSPRKTESLHSPMSS